MSLAELVRSSVERPTPRSTRWLAFLTVAV